MDEILRLGYSPCPNDTYIFFALTQGRIPIEPFRLETTLADVEALNKMALKKTLDVTKVSIHAILHLLGDYGLLRSGGALGRGCGPLAVAREKTTMKELRDRPVAIPGEMTTANLLLQLEGTHRGPLVVMPFDKIMDAVRAGTVDAGVIIHEGRFTYASRGLHLALDLGEWWEKETGLPLPLGGILMRRDLGKEKAEFVAERIRESLLYARGHSEEAWPYIRGLAQEMAPDVIRSHIDMFVNDFSLDVGDEGEKAVRYMLEAAARQGGVTLPDAPLFLDGPRGTHR